MSQPPAGHFPGTLLADPPPRALYHHLEGQIFDFVAYEVLLVDVEQVFYEPPALDFVLYLDLASEVLKLARL